MYISMRRVQLGKACSNLRGLSVAFLAESEKNKKVKTDTNGTLAKAKGNCNQFKA